MPTGPIRTARDQLATFIDRVARRHERAVIEEGVTALERGDFVEGVEAVRALRK